MAIANLAATAVSLDNSWLAANPSGGANKVPNINSFDLISGSGSRITETNTAGDRQGFLWDSLPAEADTILPGGFELEYTSRRAGGSTTGTHKAFVRNNDAGTRKFGPTRTAGLADNPMQQNFDIFGTAADDSVWKPTTVNQIAVGWEIVSLSTGTNIFFGVLNVTWSASGGGHVIDGIGWLGPLVLAGLRGLNLFSLRDDEIAHLDRKVFRPIWQRAGLKWYPALSMRSEREQVFGQLFKHPAFILVGR